MTALKVLIVDDEMLSRKALISGVDWKALGVGTVLDAASAKSARMLLLSEKVDLMLIDIEMPEESGLELLEWIRNTARLDIPCAFLTCHASFQFAQTAIRLNCFDYLLKPIEYSEVETVVRKMITSYLNESRQKQAAEYGRQWVTEREQEGKKYEKEKTDLDSVIEEQVLYIRSHLGEKLLLTDLAANAGFNLNYFNKVFKEKTGETVNKFIVNERMKLAAELLKEGNLRAYAISEVVGYDNYSHFVNTFKKTYGVSPDRYREENCKH